MACSSDEEKFEIESILEQRKRKGILQYLVQWKEGDSTWEPAESIATDCALAIETFLNKQKKRRSSSKTRKSSRSRSRSRGRKGTTKPVRRSTRSRSRGRPSKEAVKQFTTEEEDANKIRKSPEKKEETETESKVVSETKFSTSASSSSSATVKQSSSFTSTSEKSDSFSGRFLRSSTMESRKKLEVQRVHNDQRPVREDDNRPRSVIWKVADYAVIVLFIISIFAASIMFLEKFMDLDNFKKQALPNFETLTSRLIAAKDHLMDFVYFGWDRTSDAWDYILEQVKQPSQEQPVSAQ